jgi:hypothetical protein
VAKAGTNDSPAEGALRSLCDGAFEILESRLEHLTTLKEWCRQAHDITERWGPKGLSEAEAGKWLVAEYKLEVGPRWDVNLKTEGKGADYLNELGKLESLENAIRAHVIDELSGGVWSLWAYQGLKLTRVRLDLIKSDQLRFDSDEWEHSGAKLSVRLARTETPASGTVSTKVRQRRTRPKGRARPERVPIHNFLKELRQKGQQPEEYERDKLKHLIELKLGKECPSRQTLDRALDEDLVINAVGKLRQAGYRPEECGQAELRHLIREKLGAKCPPQQTLDRILDELELGK